MSRTWLILPVVAGLLLTGVTARAEISGFQLNKIEGVGDLKGKLDDRLVDDQQVSYADCLVYLEGAGAVDASVACSTDTDCTDTSKPACAILDGTAGCVECLAASDCIGGDKPLCDIQTHVCVAAPTMGECTTSSDCKDKSKPVCALVQGEWACVACADDEQCPDGQVCQVSGGTFDCVEAGDPPECEACFALDESCALNDKDWICVECVLDLECENKQVGWVCDQATHACGVPPADGGCALAPGSCPKETPVCALVNQQWVCVACVTQSDCEAAGSMFTCNQVTHQCVDSCAACPSSCLSVGGEWGCVACLDTTDCVAPQVCDPGTHQCVIPPTAGTCSTTADCQGSGVCALYNGAWMCVECTDSRDCIDSTMPACATVQGTPKCVECARDADCSEGTCNSASHTCGTGTTTTGTKPKILIRWSLTPSSGYDYAIKVGSCSDTGGIGDEATDSCKYVVNRTALPGATNNEFQVDLRDLIGDSCVFGDTGTASLYFFIQYGDDVTTKEVEVVEFEWDYEPPDQPQNIVVEAGESNLKVTWDDESGTGAEEFKVYWSDKTFDDASRDQASSKGSITAKSYQISGLKVGTTYFVGVTAVDDCGNESKLPELLDGTPISVDDFWEHYQKAGGQEEGGFCFVATAAFGTQMEPSVVTLRLFRDRVLMASPWGRGLVGMYYTWGPLAASFIKGSPELRFVARTALMPAVALAWFTVEASQAERFVVALVLAMAAAWFWRRRLVAARPGRVA